MSSRRFPHAGCVVGMQVDLARRLIIGTRRPPVLGKGQPFDDVTQISGMSKLVD